MYIRNKGMIPFSIFRTTAAGTTTMNTLPVFNSQQHTLYMYITIEDTVVDVQIDAIDTGEINSHK